jgi:DNA-binding PadR family transcriptional regulator
VVYPTLQMLEELRHACTVPQDDRKVYAITESGQRDLAEHAGEVAEFYEGYSDVPWERHAEEVANLGKRFGHLIRLFKHGIRRGNVNPPTLRKMHAILDEAMKKLEELLSRQEP